MDPFIVDVLNMLLRWLHVIVGIAWIGASFYFVMLDTSLSAPKKKQDVERGVFGELWAVHGGGFYHSQKYLTGPQGEPLSNDLHWAKWEAYFTWMSGICLLAIIYWYGADIYLIAPESLVTTQASAIAVSLAFLIGAWLIYNFLCRSVLAKNESVLGGVIFILVSFAAWGLCELFTGRGAYITFGAMLGTVMAANVFFVIIPGQKQMISAIRAGQAVDPQPGIDGKQRSVHNTYFTLPVLFTMISNHYAMTYGHEANWLVLMTLCLAGAAIRVFFVSRHGAGSPNYIILGLGIAMLLAASIMLAPVPSLNQTSQNQIAGESVKAERVNIEEIQLIINTRCTVCHSATPTQAGFISPPKGIVYDSVKDIELQATIIHKQAVLTKAMPIGNLTGMSDAEREKIHTWFSALSNQTH